MPEIQSTLSNQNITATFRIFAAGTEWGSIVGTLSNQTDLQEALDAKEDVISADNKLNADFVNDTDTTNKFVTTSQINTWNTALQPNDNITELTNNAGYITKDVNNLTNYTTTTNLNTALSGKQDVISDLATIRAGATAGATALQAQEYGTIVINI